MGGFCLLAITVSYPCILLACALKNDVNTSSFVCLLSPYSERQIHREHVRPGQRAVGGSLQAAGARQEVSAGTGSTQGRKRRPKDFIHDRRHRCDLPLLPIITIT